jgi:Uma2 family endonuclease
MTHEQLEVSSDMRPDTRGSLELVSTIVRDPKPAEFEALLERRRRLGQDRWDEERDGVYYMNPSPTYEHQRLSQQVAVILDPLAKRAGLEAVVGGVNVGEKGNYVIPDASLHRPGAGGTYVPTAALAIEILSPDDDTWEKLPFYARRRVEELAIVDPRKRRVKWLALGADGEYREVERSRVIELSPAELAERLDWPR